MLLQSLCLNGGTPYDRPSTRVRYFINPTLEGLTHSQHSSPLCGDALRATPPQSNFWRVKCSIFGGGTWKQLGRHRLRNDFND